MHRMEHCAGTCIIDQDIQFPVSIQRTLHDFFDVFLFGDIGFAKYCLAACFADILRNGFSLFFSPGRQNDLHSVVSKHSRDCLSDPCCCACNDCDFSLNTLKVNHDASSHFVESLWMQASDSISGLSRSYNCSILNCTVSSGLSLATY